MTGAESVPRGADWFAGVRAQGVVRVAQAFGLQRGRGRSLSPCPACLQPTRHRKTGDERGALGLTSEGQGFRCFQCDTSGDAVTVAALVVTGEPTPGRERWAEVRRACAELGLCDADPRDGRLPSVVR